MGIEDRDYFQEDRARRERKQDYVDMHYDPRQFRGSGAGVATPPVLKEIFRKPAVAWSLGLTLGLLGGIAATSIAAVANVDLLDRPLWWAIHVVDWVKQ